MKRSLTLLFMCGGTGAYACTTCNKSLQEAIFDSTFYPNLFTMLLAFIVLAVVVGMLIALALKLEKKRITNQPSTARAVPLFSAAVILGIGIGGFIDGVVLHQILQWHEMLSNKIPPVTLLNKSVNMFWDGVFHAFCLIVTIVGLYLLFGLLHRKDVLASWRVFNGGLLLGWGVFNLVEGIIDHQVLKLHNVREITLNVPTWNYGFLIFSVVLIALGSVLAFKRQRNVG